MKTLIYIYIICTPLVSFNGFSDNLKLNLIKITRKDLNTLSLPGRGVIVVQETLLFGSVAPSCTPYLKNIP